MPELPAAVGAAFLRATVAGREPAWLLLDGALRLVASGGALARYGLGSLQAGALVAEEVLYLHDLLLANAGSQRIEGLVLRDCAADVHLLTGEPHAAVLLLDATERVRREGQLAVKAQAYDRLGATLAPALDALGIVILERTGKGLLRPALPLSPPARALLQPVHPRCEEVAPRPACRPLVAFLAAAEDLWASGASGELTSGSWLQRQRNAAGTRWTAQALARRGAPPLLVLRWAGDGIGSARGSCSSGDMP